MRRFLSSDGPSPAWTVALIALFVGLAISAVAQGAPPANDDFNSARVAPSVPFRDAVAVVDATAAVDDPRPSCTPGALAWSVWWAYTPSAPARIQAHRGVSGLAATVLAAYTGTRGALTEVACEVLSQTSHRATLRVMPGTTYYFLAGSVNPAIYFSLEALPFVLEVAPPDKKSELTLRASRQLVTYGEAVRLEARLAEFAHVQNRTVTIHARSRSGAERVVASREVDPATGVFAVRTRPRAWTELYATWAGDDEYLPTASKRVRVEVHVRVATRIRGARGASGRYKLFRVGDLLVQTGSVVPLHAGTRLRFALEWRHDGWPRLGTPGVRMNRNGSATMGLRFGTPGVYRVRNEFPGDADHAWTPGRWVYLRVMR